MLRQLVLAGPIEPCGPAVGKPAVGRLFGKATAGCIGWFGAVGANLSGDLMAWVYTANTGSPEARQAWLG